MNEYIYGIKVLSNMIVIRFAENDIFMNVLKTHISKNFTSIMSLRHSTFIFHRSNEDLKRKIFLNWMNNLYQKSTKSADKNMLQKLLANPRLTICMQIIPNSKIVESIKIFSYFMGTKILFRASDSNSPIFGYIKTAFKNQKLQIRHDGQNLYVDMSDADAVEALKIKRLYGQKLSLGGKSYILVYNQKEFILFFTKFASSSNQNSHNDKSKYNNGSRFRQSYHDERVDDSETLTDAQRIAQSLKMLGCSENEDMSAIKKRYFTLAKEYHPDMHHGKDASAIKILTEKFIQIKSAYDFIVEIKSGKVAA